MWLLQPHHGLKCHFRPVAELYFGSFFYEAAKRFVFWLVTFVRNNVGADLGFFLKHFRAFFQKSVFLSHHTPRIVVHFLSLLPCLVCCLLLSAALPCLLPCLVSCLVLSAALLCLLPCLVYCLFYYAALFGLLPCLACCLVLSAALLCLQVLI